VSIALGPFLLEARIGRGGMGVVWRGRHRREGIPIAVKVLRAEQGRRFVRRAQFRSEVEAVARLDHPHVVLVFDHGEIDARAAEDSAGRLVAGDPYLVMELASGGSLEDAPPASWNGLRAVLRSLLDALAHAHARGVIHRDLKPANVLLAGADDLRPGLKLSDFGLAHAADAFGGEAGMQAVAGTPRYMAPEQFEGRWRDYGPWTDLYALGCVAFELASGHPPFEGDVPAALATAHAEVDPPELRPLLPTPPGFDAWIRRALEKEPARRFLRAADAAWALDRLGEAPGARREPVERARRDARSTAQVTALTWSEVEIEAAASPAQKDAVLDPEPPPLLARWGMPDPAGPRRTDMRLVGTGLGLHGLRTVPLAGREAERDVLWQAFREAHSGRQARLVLLRGAAGYGKSRLAAWLCERAHETGAATILRATHGPGGGPAHGLGRMLAEHFGVGGLAPPEVFARIGASVARDLDEASRLGLAEVASPGAGGVRFERPTQRHALLVRYVERLARARPVVIWLDDVQWADDAIGFAEHLLDVQAERPIPALLVLTAQEEALAERPAEAEHLGRTLGLPGARALDVGPLAPVEQTALVEGLLGLESGVAARVASRAAGNPLFALQLVGDWVARDVLEVRPTGFALRPGADVPLPDELWRLWTARIDRVLEDEPSDARVALELAAVAGRDVDFERWRLACAEAGVPVAAALVTKLVANRLATPAPGDLGARGDWSFAHNMLRESIERTARAAGRWASHNAVFASLVRPRALRGEPGAAGLWGRFLLESGEPASAAAPLLAAAREEYGRCELYSTLDLLAKYGDSTRNQAAGDDVAEARLLEASVRLDLGELDAAGALATSVVAEGDESVSTGSQLEALVVLGIVERDRGNLEAAETCFRRGTDLAERLGDKVTMAKALRALAHTQRIRRRFPDAFENFERARALSKEAGDDVGAAWAVQGQANVAASLGDQASSARLAEEGLITFQRLGIGWGVALCAGALAEAARFLGDYEAAEREYRRAIRVAETLGVRTRHFIRMNLALLLLRRGDYAQAEPDFDRCRLVFGRMRNRTRLAVVRGGLLACAAAKAIWRDFDVHLVDERALLAETSYVEEDVAWPAELAGDLALAAGERARAIAAWTIALDQWRRLGRAEAAHALEERLSDPGSIEGSPRSGDAS
jgi:tetratricopeptide (TPR) repeat protein